MQLTFDIHDWKAWFPSQSHTQPNMAAIPAMLRRRLSPMARAAMSVILPLAEAHGAMPLVYVSRHGELSRTLSLLGDLAKGEPLSPTAFALSVHNATAGLFSIQQELTKNITAISCGAQELAPALLESLGLCNDDEPSILCVFCDEPPPSPYTHQTNQPTMPYAFAMIIQRGQDWELTTTDYSKASNEQESSPQIWQLYELLKQGGLTMSFASNGIDWWLRRCRP